MSGVLEGAVLKLGTAIATQGAKSWLQRKQDRTRRESSIAELAAAELTGPLQLRKLDNLVERIGFQVAEQLEPVLHGRFGELPPNEIEAAALAVTDTLAEADLSDAALLAADADPERLAATVRARFPDRARKALLTDGACELYELGLDLACRHLVQVVRHLPSFQPRALGEALGRLSRQADQLDEILARVPKTSLHAPTGTDHDGEFRQEYLRFLVRARDRLELLGLDADEHPALPLTVAYLSLSVTTGTAVQGVDPRELWFDEHDAQHGGSSVRVETAIGGSHRILVRGEAGSGKTTLLDWLAVSAANGAFTGDLREWHGLVPFPVRLRAFTTAELPRPEQIVEHAAGAVAARMPVGWAHRVLESGRALVLVDGVDEVLASRRREVRTWLRELVATFPGARYVVTSRTAAASAEWLRGEGFDSVVLDPMDAGDIHALVERWHRAAESGGSVHDDLDLAAAQRRLLGQFDSRPHLRSLAASPLLCAMLCALNLAHRSALPRDRMDLYRKALTMLLHLRDAERRITVLLGAADKQILLGDLAWRLTLGGRIELSVAKVREHIERRLPSLPNVSADPAAVLDNLLERSGVLREPVPGRVDFVHRTFQEYLAGGEATEHGYLDTLIERAHLDTWRETVVMACGHAKQHQASELLTGILDRADAEERNARGLRLLAAACLETVRGVDADVTIRVEAAIREHLVPPRDYREVSSLASAGSRILRYLPTDPAEMSVAVAGAAIRVAALTGGDESLELLRRYARDPRDIVQSEIQAAWQYFEPERYAAEVLADAPLVAGGRLTVESQRLLRYVGELPNLRSLNVHLPNSPILDDLDFLDGVPKLRRFRAGFAEAATVDLTPLAAHPGLMQVNLFHAREFTGLAALGAIPGLARLSMQPKTRWRDLEFLAELTAAENVTVGNIAGLGALAPLSALPKLTRLGTWDCGDATPSADTPVAEQVRRLFVSRSAAGQSGAIAKLYPGLTDLVFADCAPVEISALRALSLASLELSNTGAVGFADLRAMAELRSLFLRAVPHAVDLAPLAGMRLTLELGAGFDVTGVDQLGPGADVRYFEPA